MGIKHFFYWWKTNFKQHIHNVSKDDKLRDKDINIDTLLLDLNGIFHKSAQKIFKYGSSSENNSLLTNNKAIIENNSENRILVYKDICESISGLIHISQPSKSVVLCIDGPAPRSKQYQQRQRRFTPGRDTDSEFDSNCITPGTIFMDELSNYIKSYLKHNKSTKSEWKGLDLVFSDEKVPGEGEHKAINYIKKHGMDDETFCINGPDADLIMLALATHKQNFFILRDDMYSIDNDFFCIDIKKCNVDLLKKLKWDSKEHIFDNKTVIDDFIFICFLVGNDFLPHIPSIEIIKDGIELMIDIYKEVCKVNGHFTYKTNKLKTRINLKSFKVFMNVIGMFEKQNFEEKVVSRCFPDKLLKKFIQATEPNVTLDINGYINQYNKEKFNDDIQNTCHKYIQGLHWVLTYYTESVPCWNWYFEYQYAPMASEICKYVDTYKQPRYGNTKPSLPFVQLLSVLPPSSHKLIAEPLRSILTDPPSSIKSFFPDEIKVDISGKRKEWEGITRVPMIDVKKVKNEYSKRKHNISLIDQKRNVLNNDIHI